MLLTPGAAAVELTGPEDDVRPPDGDGAAGRAAPRAGPARGLLEAGVPPPRLAELAALLEGAGLGYEARMGVGHLPRRRRDAPTTWRRARAWALEPRRPRRR